MDPRNTIIAFDLHGVLFRLDWREVFHILWGYPHKWCLFTCGFNIRLIWRCLHMVWHDAVDEEYYQLFRRLCPNILPVIIELTNAQKPIEPTVEILRTLKECGFLLHVISNIGPQRFAVLKNRYSLIIALFDSVQISHSDEDNTLKKPDQRFFDGYMHAHNSDHKTVIFVDDSKKNIRVANKAGFIGIHFKNPQQLASVLKQLQVL